MPDGSYRTLDGSRITELIRPETSGGAKLSLAVAVLGPEESTLRHYHGSSDEAYYVLEGTGLLTINARQIEIGPGDAHLIKAGEEHNLTCLGEGPLRVLCACAPPYQHSDTVITERLLA